MGRGAMGKIATWCAGLALAGMLAGGGQTPAVVRTVGSHGAAIGSWGKAIGVPGLVALNKGGDASVVSVSCASAGNCAAGGNYADHQGVERDQGFVAIERGGRWRKAVEVPGLAALNTGRDAEVNAVSCGSASSCAVGGYYSLARSEQAFVAVERNGRWGKAVRGARPGRPEHGPAGRGRRAVVRLGGQLPGRRVLLPRPDR